MPTLPELFNQLRPLLPPDNAEHELLWLFSHYTGLPLPELRRRLTRRDLAAGLNNEQETAIRAAVQQRAAGKPLQYITGLQPFWDFDLIVSPDVLIPRWDSETVLEQALQILPPDAPCRVADICTGSGAYALTIKAERPMAEVHACDISAAALAIARQNAQKYNLPIQFHQGDLLAALPPATQQQYNLIVSNPPYVRADADLPPDVQQEPALALFGGADGLDFYRRLLNEGATDYLLPGGFLLLEIGCEQAAAVAEILQQAGLTEIRVGQDLAGLDRWIQGRRPF